MREKHWFLSAKFFTVLILVIFPISCITLFWLDYNLGFLGPIYTTLNVISIQIAIPPIPLLIVFSIFASIPAIYPIPIYFEKRGFENIVYEYRFIKNILYASIILVIALLLILYLSKIIMNVFFQGQDFTYFTEKDLELLLIDRMIGHSTSPTLVLMYVQTIVYDILYFILPIPIFIVIKFLLEQKRKQFQLYFAKACFRILIKESINEIDKARYLLMGLTWCNKFLKSAINLQINDIALIFSIIFNSPLDYNNKILISISETFNGKDGFGPLRYISTLLSDIQTSILTKEPLKSKIKESKDFIIPIITIIITILTTFFLPKPS